MTLVDSEWPPDWTPAHERLRLAAKQLWLDRGHNMSQLARDIDVDRAALDRFIKKRNAKDLGKKMLAGLAKKAPAEVAAFQGVSGPVESRPIWPGLAELLAMTEGRLEPEEVAFLRRINDLYEGDRPADEWLADLRRWRAVRDRSA